MKSQNTRMIQILVSGRVHGVGYRRFVQKAARELGIQGWTRNLMDGRVQVVASGQGTDIDKLCEMLKRGPLFALVEDIKIGDYQESISTADFLILPDGETV